MLQYAGKPYVFSSDTNVRIKASVVVDTRLIHTRITKPNKTDRLTMCFLCYLVFLLLVFCFSLLSVCRLECAARDGQCEPNAHVGTILAMCDKYLGNTAMNRL